MTFSKTMVLALTVTGSAAVAAVLAVRRHTRRQRTAQRVAALQVWENEGGRLAPPSGEAPRY